ncbi:MAG: type II secretion system F family protein [Planctomycetota bacterium]
MMTILIATMIFIAVVALGTSLIGLVAGSPATVKERLHKNEVLMQQKQAKTAEQSQLLRFLHRIGQSMASSANSAKLAANLTQAGFYSRAAPAIYFGAKILIFIGAGVFTFLLFMPSAMSLGTTLAISLVAAATCFLIPNYIVEHKRKKRSTQIKQHLPDVIDLMEICVTSGMGFETAWNLISEEIREVNPVMADEMTLTNLEVHLGTSRKEAMEHMAERTEADEVGSFATLVAQSDRFGTSIGDTLRVFAESMRDERSQSAEEKGEKVAVKLLIPMILFVFPAVAVVLAGPGIIRIASTLSQATQ